MAPILKELETPVPATPQAKPANDTSARPQPVALEIPVTVNGARTVDGSEKRVPFSESTQTVLVFPHGAVIRIATPLTSGQLVFLTNEKTKKEVVCQVVKSKSSGGAGAYVELQFTEPSIAFWGLQIPGNSAAPPAPRLVAPAATSVPKPAAPAAPAAAKPPVVAKPVVPAPVATLPAKPAVPTTPTAVVPAKPVVPVPTAVVAPELVSATPPVVEPAKISAVPQSPAAPSIAAPVLPAPAIHQNESPAPQPRDYTKQIDALFAVPQAPPVAEQAALPPAPTTEDLKQQAARLQEQLNSLLFSQKEAAPLTQKEAAPPPPATSLVTPEMMANDMSLKIADILQAGPAHPAPAGPKIVPPPAHKPGAPSLGADEEVKIPAWLAPISQNAEVIVETSDSAEASLDHGVSVNSEESFDALVSDGSSRPQTAVFGGQLLGESTADAVEASSTGSKKGLFLGLAAAGLLVIGGAWYYYQNQSNSTTAAAHTAESKPSTDVAPTANPPATPAVSAAAPNNVNSSPAPSPKPSTSSVEKTVPAPVVTTAQPRNSKPAPQNEQPAPAPAKSSLGNVHLGAPVVNRNADSQPQDADAFAAIDTKSAPAPGDPLAGAASRHNGPAAPLPVGGDVKQAQLLKSVPPEYPTIAKAQHVSGRVQIEAVIDTSGNVAGVKVISGPALLHRAALDAVKQWKYSPAVLDGQPTITHVTVNVDFRAQ
jgi:periplasmic protein TonB